MSPRPALSAFLAAVAALAAADVRPPRVYDLTHVRWRVSFEEPQGAIIGHVTNTVRPLQDGTREVWFDCGRLNVGEVRVNGRSATFTTREERLYVTLPRVARRGERLRVEIAYRGTPDAGAYFVPASRAFPATSPVIYTQGQAEDTRYWLPTYDYPDDKATTEGILAVREGQFALSNGKLLRVKRGRDGATYHWRMDQPHSTYLISFVVGNLARGHEQWAGIPIDWYVPKGLERMGQSSFGGTDRLVAFFSRLTGVKYPYAKFSQAVVPDYMFGGMENITQVTNTITTLHPPEAKPLASSTGLVAHELAHQWFGDMVTCRTWSHAWINEGFATFLPSFWTRERQGQEAYDLARLGAFEGAVGAFRSEPRPMVVEDYGAPMDAFDGHAYAGGAARMFVLMRELGERRFWGGVRDFLRRYAFRPVTTEQFFASMSRSTGRDLRPFMRQWFYTAGIPRLTVTRDGEHLVIAQREPHFRLSLPVWKLSGTEWRKQTVELSGAEARVRVGGDALALVDPEVWTPMEVTYNAGYTPEQWTTLYRNAPNAAQKTRLLGPVLQALNPDGDLALAHSESSPRLLQRIVGQLSNLPPSYLLALTRHNDASVQSAAVSALERGSADPAAITRLREIWKSDPNPVLRGTALSALLRHAGDEALAAEAWATPSYNERYRQLALGWWAQKNPDVAREVALEALRNPPSEPVRVAAIRTLGTLKDKSGERRVFDALAAVVRERSFGARMAAVNALVAYGDKAAIPLLQGLTEHSLHFVRGTARRAVEQLERRR